MESIDIIAKVVGIVILPILLVVLNLRTSRAIEKQKSDFARELQKDRAQFEAQLHATSTWHAKRVEALVELHSTYREFLSFLRRRFYVKDGVQDVTPLHEFQQNLQRISLFLDDTTKTRSDRYAGELLGFWNRAMELSENPEERAELQRYLDYEIPKYLDYIREDIQIYLGGSATGRLETSEPAIQQGQTASFPITRATDTCAGFQPREDLLQMESEKPANAAQQNAQPERRLSAESDIEGR